MIRWNTLLSVLRPGRSLAALLALVAGALPSFAAPGDRITNIAVLEFARGDVVLTRPSNAVTLDVVAPPPPPQLSSFRRVPGAPDGVDLILNGPSGGAGQLVRAVSTSAFVPGETLLVGLQAVERNRDPALIEAVTVWLAAETGDAEPLTLYETGPETGLFLGLMPTRPGLASDQDGTLSVSAGTSVTVSADPVGDRPAPAPLVLTVLGTGVVFDSSSNQPVSGVEIRLIDAVSGGPAVVFGLDGLSPAPSTLVSGATAPGAFLFPIVPAGDYRFEVRPLAGHVFPSALSLAELTPLGRAVTGEAVFGQRFTHMATGPVIIDLPVDPSVARIRLEKRALDPVASLGDVVRYEISVADASGPGVYQLRDTLPEGFRYLEGSARLGESAGLSPVVSPDGQTLTFSGANLGSGPVRLSYAAVLGAGVRPGRAINRIVAVNGAGGAISRPAEASIRVREDLFTSRAILAGQVHAGPCPAPGDPTVPGEVEPSQAVEGIRLFLETGAYVQTDSDGLFHFEDVAPGTHVVQIDTATLPEGYEAVACRDTTRRAGSAISQFVDVQGGTLWRTDFRIVRRRAPGASPDPLAPGAEASAADSLPAPLSAAQRAFEGYAGPAFIQPRPGGTPRGQSVDISVVHAAGQAVALSLNGVPVPALNAREGTDSPDERLVLSRWGGVDILRGENRLEAVVTGPDGAEVARLTHAVWFADEVHRADFLQDASTLKADGRTPPKLAFRFSDKASQPVFEGRLVEVTVAPPFRLQRLDERSRSSVLTTPYDALAATRVGPSGIGFVQLEPTLRSGRVQVTVRFDDGTTEDYEVWLEPEKRDWILVGLAEAEAVWAEAGTMPQQAAGELIRDGRLAFYAKGVVRGDWLLTVAADTDKRRRAGEDQLFDEIDPNAYYTIYGDETWQQTDAPSQYPVYIRAEKGGVRAQFGDYATGLDDTDLSRYSRQLSGLRVDYESEVLSAMAFAADTRNRFVRDELAADGTSGPFYLTQNPLVRGSERLVVETRDRQRSDRVIRVQTLVRDLDYELDVDTGLIFFRLPVPAADAAFNPNVIVVEYETLGAGDLALTAGARLEARLFDGRLEAGLSAVHEAARETGEGEAALLGADLRYDLSPRTELVLEMAQTRRDGEAGLVEGRAGLAQIEHRGDRLTLTADIREEEAGFGLGQQSSATSGRRRYGITAALDVGPVLQQASPTSRARQIETEVYREVALGQADARRDVGRLGLSHTGETLDVTLGLKAVQEVYGAAAARRDSVLLTSSLEKRFPALGLRLGMANDVPLGGNANEVSSFPARTALTLDQKLWRSATLQATHEITEGDNASGANTNVQILWEPFAGTQLRAGGDVVSQDSSRRIGATVGLDQTWQISKAWDLSLGLSRRANIDGGDDPATPVPSDPAGLFGEGARSPLVADGAYLSAYLGAGYRTDLMALSGRLEARDSVGAERWMATLTGVREVSEALSFASDARYQFESLSGGAATEALEARLGTAWRPRRGGMMILSRFDLGAESRADGTGRRKLVHNLAVHLPLSDRTEMALYHGLKYVEQELHARSYTGLVHQLGTEVRVDLTARFDVGLQASWISEALSGTGQWAVGPSLGWSPAENMWISLGWNFAGYQDDDFSLSEYARQGPFLKFRIKFDQDGIADLLQRLNMGF